MGDDFFLDMARRGLGYPVPRNHNIGRERLGLMESGMTIKQAAKKIRVVPYICKNILIHVGSTDILHGRSLIDMYFDFLELESELHQRNIKAVFCTLAPLAHLWGDRRIRDDIMAFNQFLWNQKQLLVVDLYDCFLQEDSIRVDFSNFNE